MDQINTLKVVADVLDNSGNLLITEFVSKDFFAHGGK